MQVKRILIIKPSSMGDIIHGLLIAESIKRQLPEVRIDWVVRREFAPLVRLAQAVNRIYIFERDGGISGFVRLIREIRTERYDWVLDMQGLARSGILTFFSKAGRKVGRSDAREGAGLAYGEKTAALPRGKPIHAVKILAGFLKVLGLNVELPESIRFKPTSFDFSLPTLEDDSRRLLIFPESRRVGKNWPGYESLTRYGLSARSNLQIIWCGHVPFTPVKSIDSERWINLTGKTGIDQLPQLMESAHCVLSNDSGPMHLAAALGRPLVAIFGPTDPARFGPYPHSEKRHRILRCEDGNMSAPDVDTVKDALFDVLD